LSTTEEQQFERWLAGRTAKLMDYAAPFVGRLGTADRDYFLGKAVHEAWVTRKELNPEKPEEAGLLLWWDKCLRTAAASRQQWRVSMFDGSYRFVPGNKLGVSP
jgi:hypothetical protein